MKPLRSFAILSPQVILALLGILLFASSAGATPCSPQSMFGSPTAHVTGSNPAFLATQDFNEDGRPDLAVTNCDFLNGGVNNSVAILLGQGGLSFAAPVLYPVGLNPHMLAPVDFNEDGITDLVVANKWSSSIAVLIGQGSGGVGNGSFAPAVFYPTGGYPFQIAIDDIDRDGIADLAISLNSVPAIALLQGGGSGGVGDGTFGAPITLPLANLSTGIDHGDFNGDGITDLVATENYSGTIAIYLGTGSPTFGTGSFQPAIRIAAGGLPFDFGVADFNGDGKLDLAVAEQTAGGGTAIMLGNGNGLFQPPTYLPTDNTVTVTPDDLNQDGIMDLAIGTVTGGNSGLVRIFLGMGSGGVGNGSFISGYQDASLGDTRDIVAGDFDGDGRRDLAVTYYLHDYIGVFPGLCDAATPEPAPALTDVRDVPNDQGGRVFLTWLRSALDVTGGPVNSYRVWRRIPPALAAEWLAAGTMPAEALARPADGGEAALIEYWEALATLPAQRLEGYGYTAATTQDSIAGSNPYTAFFVSALTSNIDVFYSSNVDSGYSVDNMPPPQPQPFVAQYLGNQVQLHWGVCGDADFGTFRLYRGSGAGFIPGPASLVAATCDTGFTDPAPGAASSYYKLTAADTHGNESVCALVSPTIPTAVGDPIQGVALRLRALTPTPGSDRRVTVELALPDAAPARLELVDVAGRIVLTREVGTLGAGVHRLDLDAGDPLRAGLYFVRLSRADRTVIARASVIP